MGLVIETLYWPSFATMQTIPPSVPRTSQETEYDLTRGFLSTTTRTNKHKMTSLRYSCYSPLLTTLATWLYTEPRACRNSGYLLQNIYFKSHDFFSILDPAEMSQSVLSSQIYRINKPELVSIQALLRELTIL